MKKFKVMGITAGRKNGNSEILLKEALSVCKDQDAEVIMVNLHDYNILHCTGCEACTQGMAKGVRVPCILKEKDDKDLLTNKMLEMDAVIFSVPTYDLMPCSAYLTFAHRNLAYETSFLQKIGAIEKKARIAGLISVGGSTRSWQGLALESMAATMFTNAFQIVDMMLATRVSRPGYVLLKQELIHRARTLGENIM
ncbi:MAG: flavodoxin family protein, partial [Eubacteriaceae bacterium]|nr:flavodoxin family protein [Eubacteriaceae bacterium]